MTLLAAEPGAVVKLKGSGSAHQRRLTQNRGQGIAYGAGNLTADEAVGTFELIAEDGRCWRAELRHAAGSAVPRVVEAGVTAALHFVCARDRVLRQTAQCIGALKRLWYSQSIPSTRRITLDLALLETC